MIKYVAQHICMPSFNPEDEYDALTCPVSLTSLKRRHRRDCRVSLCRNQVVFTFLISDRRAYLAQFECDQLQAAAKYRKPRQRCAYGAERAARHTRLESIEAPCPVMARRVPFLERRAGVKVRKPPRLRLRAGSVSFGSAPDRALPPHGGPIRVGLPVDPPARPDAPVAPVDWVATDRISLPVRGPGTGQKRVLGCASPHRVATRRPAHKPEKAGYAELPGSGRQAAGLSKA